MDSVGGTGLLEKIRLVGVVLLMAIGTVACQTKKPLEAPPKQEAAPKKRVVVPKVVDTKAQETIYNQGVRAYSMEDYEAAKTAFQRVIDMGPDSEWGLKAGDNLKKVSQVLRTLAEIGPESKVKAEPKASVRPIVRAKHPIKAKAKSKSKSKSEAKLR